MYKKLFFGLFLVFLFSFSLVSAATVPDNADTVAYWAMEDLTDSTPNSNDLTNASGGGGTNGIIDAAFNYDGSSDYYDIPDLSTTSNSFTINFWVDPNAYTSMTAGQFFQIGSDSNNFVRLWEKDADSTLQFQVNYGGTYTNYQPSNSVLSTAKYSMVTMVVDTVSNTFEVYIDGSISGNVSYTDGTISFSDGRLGTGVFANNGNYFGGNIDEFSVFDNRLTANQVYYLYNSGSPGTQQQYPFGNSYTVNVTGNYLSPNSSVYTDETDLRGYITVNDTNDVAINYTYKVNGSDITSGTYSGSPSGSTYTLPVFSNTNFAQTDIVTVTAFAVNSSNTSQQLSEATTSSGVTIQNRAPSAVLTWSTNAPLNDTNFSGIITPSDSDQDDLDITFDVYKNGLKISNGSNNNNAYPYGDITLFTIDSSTTAVGDNYSFIVNVTDGFDTYNSGFSDNATVTVTANFTIIVTDEWSGAAVNNLSVLSMLANTTSTTTNTASGTKTWFITNDANYSYGSIYFNNFYYELDYRCVTNQSTVTFTKFTGDSILYCVRPSGGSFANEPVINDFDGENTINHTLFNGTYNNFNSTVITSLVSNETGIVGVAAPDYFTRLYYDYNFSENLIAELHQSEYSFNAYEYLSGDLLTGVTFTISGQSYDQFNLSEGSYTVTASKAGYYNTTLDFNATALAQETLDITGMYNAKINLSVVDAINDTVLTFSGYVYNVAEDAYTNFSNVSQYYTVNAIDGEYQVYVESDGYVINASNTVTQTISSGVTLIEFGLYPAKTVIVNLYDEVSGNLLNNITINLTLVPGVANTSTSNGTYRWDTLAATDYVLQYSSAGYITRYYPFTLGSNDFYNLTLYMLANNSGASPITIEVIDDQYSDVPGAIVKALKYDSSTGTYYQVTSGTTNSEGEVILYLFKNNGFYRFIVQVDGVTVGSTSPAVITADTLLIPVVLSSELFGSFFDYLDYDYSLTFNDATDTFRFIYNDVTNAISTQACLKVFRLTSSGGETQINSSCSSSNAATLLAGITPVNGTIYVAKAYYDNSVIATLTEEYVNQPNISSLGWFGQLLILMVFGLAGLIAPEMLPVSIGTSFVVGRLLGFNVLPWSVVAGLVVIGLIVSFIINKNKG